MRLLIDTHSLLWFCEGSSALSVAAREAMEDETHTRYVSHATAWELAIKISLGKLKLSVDYDLFFSKVLPANGFELLPPQTAHYQALISLPKHHGDPFDRLMIAQAQVEGLTLVSFDSQFSHYGVPILW